jgi:rare lipoprotein A
VPAEAFTGANQRAAGHDRGENLRDAGAGARVHLARATFDDDDDDDEARPARRWRTDGRHWQRPRHAKPRHVRSARRAWHRSARYGMKQRHVTRRSARRTARNAVRSTRRAAAVAVPAGAGSTGVASYYGGRFHGRLTASGVRFNQNEMTAAHRTLPFGTRVRVTHLGSGRSVDVRINDRGPYVGGRIIDLSQGAAGVLGMHHQGVARVKVTVLSR